ncbi:AAA family ATPase [Rhodanobacter aciditrophus]|uniref:AAA family ATPase n=1 Tax=Rhodanobacter aciditrophus TaxID=1623218 RepID=UPI003CF5BEC2
MTEKKATPYVASIRMMAWNKGTVSMTIRTRKKRTIVDHSVAEVEAPAIVCLWMLRCLVPLHGFRGLVQKEYLENDGVARAVGLGDWVDRQYEEFDQGKVIAELRSRHREIERVARKCDCPETLRRNIRRMADLIGLNEIEQAVLAFAVMIHSDKHLGVAASYLGDQSLQQLYANLSSILHLPEALVRNAFSSRSVLSRSGLVKLDRDSCFDLKNRLDVISGNFVDVMLGEEADPAELLRGKVEVASQATLTLADYQHLDTPLDILVPYLKQVLREGLAGVNVFLHGPPGTGKSQLARVLAAEVGCELFEVAGADEDGDPLDAEKRLRAVRAGQCFFASRDAMIVFDETEDVFNDGGLMRESTAKSHKAWMNRLLEGNAVPTLWLSNRIDDMDPAFIRRFDMVVEVPVPPRAQRERIVRALCADAVDDGVIRRLAQEEKLAPAVVAQANDVMRRLGSSLPHEQAGKVLLHLVGSTLTAQGHARVGGKDAQQLPDIYDPAFINADVDLKGIAERLKDVRSARLCLYGPPGTGKTAYGRWLAEQLDMPLLVKRASDLMSPYVGENEQNIAAAFCAASRDGALLLIDEVDSFLRDREGASRSWEATLVNEMLTQMEAFEGVFVASTNLMVGLDQAALRRFDLKVRFDYLQAWQAAGLLRRYGERLGLALPSDLERVAADHLEYVTPGDFAAVMRQQRFHAAVNFGDFLEALKGETMFKAVSKPKIGFVH